MAFIQIVDTKRLWCQSKFGFNMSALHRNYAFGTYTFADDRKEASVILDTHSDKRYNKNPLVCGPPFVRFYAGASIKVAGYEVGVLSIMDTKPRPDFSEEDYESLIEIAAMVSDLLNERYEQNVLSLTRLSWLQTSIFMLIRSPILDLLLKQTVLFELSKELDLKRLDLKAFENFKSFLDDFNSRVSYLEELLALSLHVVVRIFNVDNQGLLRPLFLKLSTNPWMKSIRDNLGHYVKTNDYEEWLFEEKDEHNSFENKTIYAHHDVLQFALNVFATVSGPLDLIETVTIGCETFYELDPCMRNAIKSSCEGDSIDKLLKSPSYDESLWSSGNLVARIVCRDANITFDLSDHLSALQAVVGWVYGQVSLTKVYIPGANALMETIVVISVPCAIYTHECHTQENSPYSFSLSGSFQCSTKENAETTTDFGYGSVKSNAITSSGKEKLRAISIVAKSFLSRIVGYKSVESVTPFLGG